MPTARALTACIVGALCGLFCAALGAAPAAAVPGEPVLFGSTAKRAEFAVGPEGVELRFYGLRPALGLGADLRERGGPGLGPRRLAASVGRGSILTVELYGVSRWKDSLSVWVERARADGGRLVVRGKRIDPGRGVRIRQSFNAPDRFLPARMRAVGLLFDTEPRGEPVVGLAGKPVRNAVLATGTVPRARAARPLAAASGESGLEHEAQAIPGNTADLIETGVETARFSCEVASWSALPLTVIVQSSFAVQSAQPFEGELATPKNGEVLDFKTVPGLGEATPYRATIDVSVRYPAPVLGALSLNVRPSPYAGNGREAIVAVCNGSVYGGPAIGSGYGQMEPGFTANGIYVGDAEAAPAHRGPRKTPPPELPPEGEASQDRAGQRS